MMLGIYLHAAISFMVTTLPWIPKDPRNHILFDLTVGIIHGFRMQLFFVLAGFFANLVFRRIGLGAFLRRRALRIGVPFVIGMITIIPLTLAAWMWGASVSDHGSENNFDESLGSILDFPSGHLWFLQYLLVFYLISALSIRLPMQGFSNWSASVIDRLMKSRWKPIPLMLLSTPFLLTGPQIGEPEAPGMSLRMTINAIGYYGTFFWFGWMLFRCRDALDWLTRFPVSCATLAVFGFIGYVGAIELEMKTTAANPALIRLFGNMSAGIYTWSTIFLVTGLVLRCFSRPTRWGSYWADASYWFYVVHLPVVVALQIVVHHWNLNPFAKCAFVCMVTIAFLWTTYHWCVRYTFIGAILNGRRRSQ